QPGHIERAPLVLRVVPEYQRVLLRVEAALRLVRVRRQPFAVADVVVAGAGGLAVVARGDDAAPRGEDHRRVARPHRPRLVGARARTWTVRRSPAPRASSRRVSPVSCLFPRPLVRRAAGRMRPLSEHTRKEYQTPFRRATGPRPGRRTTMQPLNDLVRPRLRAA